ncbi:NUDIX hydrolase [Candidatus Woesebacteria bacterium]|nr:NUDIX hydrolase [Candidatus Woesebacteria bacterium]
MITCTFDDGGKGSLRHVCVDGLVIKDKSVLLVKRSMKVTTDPGKLAIPGGYLDRGETTIEGVRREILEETGYRVQDGTLFHIRDCPNNLNDFERQNVGFTYLFTDAERDVQAKIDWDSDSSQWCPLSEIDTIKETLAFDHWHMIMAYISYLEHKGELPVWNAYLKFS